MKWEILAIDVWGNAKDGYEINDQHGTGIVFETEDTDDDKIVLKKLRASLGHRADARGYHDPYQEENMLCFCRNRDNKPAYFARKV